MVRVVVTSRTLWSTKLSAWFSVKTCEGQQGNKEEAHTIGRIVIGCAKVAGACVILDSGTFERCGELPMRPTDGK